MLELSDYQSLNKDLAKALGWIRGTPTWGDRYEILEFKEDPEGAWYRTGPEELQLVIDNDWCYNQFLCFELLIEHKLNIFQNDKIIKISDNKDIYVSEIFCKWHSSRYRAMCYAIVSAVEAKLKFEKNE